MDYNDDGAALGESHTYESYLEYTFTSGGTYYLGVSGYRNNAYNAVSGTGDASGSTGDYTLILTDKTSVQDDAYENNDAKSIVDGRSEGGVNSPNLGILAQRLEINNLKQMDSADWYKFRTDRPGTTANFVSIEFAHSQGDLDMVVYRSDGTTVVGSSTGVGNQEYMNLNNQPAGTYYVKVYGWNGATNPNYTLTIDPPSESPGGPENYAVLFSGGFDARNNFERYYLNIRDMYDTLISDCSLERDHIYVLFADGTEDGLDQNQGTRTTPDLVNSDLSYAAGSHVSSASQANLQATLNTLATYHRRRRQLPVLFLRSRLG